MAGRTSWIELQHQLLQLAQSQLFFVGGAPRSGTTWLQSLLDAHPEISCHGEGLFLRHLAEPLDLMQASRREALEDKNRTVFRHTSGYALPGMDDCDHLLGTAVLLALAQQSNGGTYKAIGEKTPENVFLFERLKRIFPAAKFIGIARDPRDVLTSAWHFFRKPVAPEDAPAAKIAFIRSALPSLNQGARTMIGLAGQYEMDCRIVTYENMHNAPGTIATGLFRFLGVSDDSSVVADCIARTSFTAASGDRGRNAGPDGSFFRKGVVGDWRSTLTAEMSDIILRETGWMFPKFGWTP